MSLKTYIERAEKAAGGQKALARIVGVTDSNLRGAKAGLRGLPVAACYQIAEMIGEDERVVVAASELLTEKKPERRAVLLPFVGHALSMILTAVILIVTPTPSQAAPMLQVTDSTLYIMSNLRRLIAHLKQRILEAFKVCIPEPRLRSFILRVDHVTA